MKTLSQAQETMIDSWIRQAEQSKLQPSEMLDLDDKMLAIVNSIEYEKKLSFPRINPDELVSKI